MEENYFDVLVNFTCTVELTDESGTVFQLDHSGQLELVMDEEEIEETDDSDYMSEILKSTLEYIADVQREGEPFQNSKSLSFTIRNYEVIVSQ